MWSFIANILKPKNKDKKEWLEKLYENIEMIKDMELVIPFKIIDIKDNSFLIKTKGLYAYVHFSRMPWKYRYLECWEAVFPSLKGKIFFGKVLQINKKSDNKGSRWIYVDAAATILKEAELYYNMDYRGIVILKKLDGVIVDIGCHFDWKCGSLQGYLHQSRFSTPESFIDCKPGQEIIVSYLDKNAKGFVFTYEGYVDLRMEYTGATVKAKVCRNAAGYCSFMVEDKYKAKIPIIKSIYGEDMVLIKNVAKYWLDGEVIDCKVLSVNPRDELFTLKLLPMNEIESEQYFQDMKKYVGETVPVSIHRNGANEPTLFVENKYRAMLLGTKGKTDRELEQMPEGTIIECVVVFIDTQYGLIIVSTPESVSFHLIK